MLSHGNVLAFSPQNTDPVRHPILINLAKSYERVRILFDKKNENYHYAAIFNHPMLFREPRDKQTLDPTYLEIENNPMLIQKFASQELQNFCGPDGVMTRAGLQLTVTGYVRLSNALLCFLERIDVDRNTNGESSKIFETFCTIKKPAKKCCIFLASSRIQDLDKLTTTATFFRLVGLEYTGNKNYEVNVSWWNFSFLLNRIRTFAFKFYNNILGLNTRTAHFIINPNRNCTFCSLRDGSAVDESFLHLFFQCPTTHNWQNEFTRQKLNGIAANENDSKKLWFLGTCGGSAFMVSWAYMTYSYGVE